MENQMIESTTKIRNWAKLEKVSSQKIMIQHSIFETIKI